LLVIHSVPAEVLRDCRDVAFDLIVGHFFHRLGLVLDGQRKHLAEQRHEGDRLILRPFHEIIDAADLVERGEDHLFDLGGELVFRA